MSGLDRAPASAAPASKSKSRLKLSKEDEEDLAMLDRTFHRIKQSVPAAPYILSTPSLHPYNHYSKTEAQAFMMVNLFDRDEESIQYRTFHYREPYQDCFVLQPGEEVAEVNRPRSQASNTPHQGPRQKIAFSAYSKSKPVNGVATPGSKLVSPNIAPTKPSPPQINGVKETTKQPVPSSKPGEIKSHKRPAPDTLVSEKPEKRIREEKPASQPLRKSPAPEQKTQTDTSTPSHSTPHGLPPLLSPVDQPFGNPYDLPAILSPTLPARVQAELDKLETQRKRGDSNSSNSSSDRKSQLLSVPEIPSVKSGENAKPRIRSVSLSSVNNKSPNLRPTPGPKLLVKLKYGKRVAANVSRILRLPPARKGPSTIVKKNRDDLPKEASEPVRGKTAGEVVNKSKDVPKITARRVETPTSASKTVTAAKVPQKRPRSESDASLAVPSKRPKSSQDGFSTPAQQTESSPALSNKSSTNKNSQAPYATPRKDLKAVNMLRTLSAEGSESTPGRSGGTPSSSKPLDARSAPTSAPVTGKKQTDYQSLSNTSQKLNVMGRSLKHEAQKITIEQGKHITKDDEKRVAVMSLECILSYMAAYHAQDQSQNVRGRLGEVEATWKTLLPLCMSYDRRTKEFSHLDGLRLYLSAVIAAAICTHVAPRAPRPRAHDSPQDPPRPDPAQDPPRPDQAKPNPTSENFTLLADHYIKLLRFTQEARTMLPLDEIQKQYPKSWAGRNHDGKLASQPEKPNGSNFSGPYFLPIQTDTTPIQAVRFGLRFLDEFCVKEKLGYKLRVNLEKPE